MPSRPGNTTRFRISGTLPGSIGAWLPNPPHLFLAEEARIHFAPSRGDAHQPSPEARLGAGRGHRHFSGGMSATAFTATSGPNSWSSSSRPNPRSCTESWDTATTGLCRVSTRPSSAAESARSTYGLPFPSWEKTRRCAPIRIFRRRPYSIMTDSVAAAIREITSRGEARAR